MPLAALLARENLNVAADRALGHYTHEKSPIAAAAALATIEFIESENLLTHVCALSKFALRHLRAMQRRQPLIGEVRGLGLILGVELVKDRATMERATDAADLVLYEALSHGLDFKVSMGNILLLMPALTITKEEMKRALVILEEAINTVSRLKR
ncbi:MAG TPA: aminotransferase class III-fold pyridoxal phosphate-dependent enzyme [Verrucomicrobiae bacterium]|nr:aminotransferase class III-fold pyridoxal phosphate-dependent enzyme [Verrucomicrobiae bacterium]